MAHSIAAIIRCRLTRRFGDRFSIYSGPCSRSGALKGIEMRAALFALTLTALVSPAAAKCTVGQECSWTSAARQAQRNWSNCLLQTVPVQLAKTDNVNAAMAAVFAHWSIEEEGLYAQLQIDWHMTADAEAKLRALARAGHKAKILDLAKNGPAAEKCRRALREGASSC